MNAFAGLYDIRDATPQDKNFVLATSLRGLYYGDSWFSMTHKPSFMQHYKLVIEKLFETQTVKIACLKEDKDVILGYSILSNDFSTIHYCFVKSAWRNKGIARSLTPAYPTKVTHLTALGRELLPKYPGIVFDPFSM